MSRTTPEGRSRFWAEEPLEVGVLLQLKAAVDHGIDLRSGDPDRARAQRYVDQQGMAGASQSPLPPSPGTSQISTTFRAM